jgi:predicted 3-demethylubiquinone-9 3-methyltransferase (glyoxalase superfamily)
MRDCWVRLTNEWLAGTTVRISPHMSQCCIWSVLRRSGPQLHVLKEGASDTALRLVESDLPAGTMPAMNKLAPFLWFNDNAEEAAEFYLSVFPHARRLDELRSKGVGPWPVGKIASITIELEGQEMVFLNGGPAHQLNPAFSFFVRCDSQEEIDSYWDKLIEGGKPMACGWLTDRFGLCWQIVPRNIGELISHPKAMEAMMGMIKMDLPALEAAAREN